MFGKNIPIKPVYAAAKTLQVISIFKTIQGEGPLSGEPAIFVRLAGCNLKCHFCDTEFTAGAREMSLLSIAEQVEFLAGEAISLVVLTGGEPLAQPIVPLIAELSKRQFFVQIETAGTVWQQGLEHFVDLEEATIVCSPKTPVVHGMIETHCEHYKYIIRVGETAEYDGLPNKSTQVEGKGSSIYSPPGSRIENGQVTIWVQPCDEYVQDGGPDPAHDFAKVKANMNLCVELAQRHGYRISFQLHKVLGVE